MGWGRTLLLGNIGNRLDIDDIEQTVAQLRFQLNARRRVQQDVDQSQDERLLRLETDCAEMKLYLAALVRLLIGKGTIDREEFTRFVDIIDRSDGAADGRFGGSLA
jgi:hypothetical protein